MPAQHYRPESILSILANDEQQYQANQLREAMEKVKSQMMTIKEFYAYLEGKDGARKMIKAWPIASSMISEPSQDTLTIEYPAFAE